MVFLPALLSSRDPPSPAQVEEKLLPPPVIQHDTEAEKQLIREVRLRAGGREAPAEASFLPPSLWGWSWYSLPEDLRKPKLREAP